MNKYLIFRTDKIGDFILSALLIKTIKRNDKSCKIAVIASQKNYNYIKNFALVDNVILYPQDSIIGRFKLALYLLKHKFFCTIAAIPPTYIDAIDKKTIICLHSSINKINGSKQNLYIKAIPANFGTIAKKPVIAVGAPS